MQLTNLRTTSKVTRSPHRNLRANHQTEPASKLPPGARAHPAFSPARGSDAAGDATFTMEPRPVTQDSAALSRDFAALTREGATRAQATRPFTRESAAGSRVSGAAAGVNTAASQAISVRISRGFFRGVRRCGSQALRQGFLSHRRRRGVISPEPPLNPPAPGVETTGMPDFLPSRELDLLSWSRRFSQTISSDPGAFSLSQQDVDDFALLQASYASAIQTAYQPDTNSTTARVIKRETKRTMKQEARRLARIIRAAGVDDAKLSQLGLHIPDRTLTPGNTPEAAPKVNLGRCIDGILPIRLSDRESERRGRPPGTAGAVVFVHYGDEAPPSVETWGKQMLTGRTRLSIIIAPGTPMGTRVWITACWLGTRLQRGPAAMPVSTQVLGGAFGVPTGLRLAA